MEEKTETETNIKPTLDMYKFMQTCYDWFNERLFDNSLSSCIITFQREKQTCGYFSHQRWQSNEKNVDEIALNPNFFVTIRPLELMQTLVHEMCHKWQHQFGTPSRGGYHNKEWANKMESIGLMPSSTGKVGGKKTGQRMSDYPITGGLFEIACTMLANGGYKLPYIDVKTGLYQPSGEDLTTSGMPLILDSPFVEQVKLDYGNSNLSYSLENPPINKKKTKYTCPDCKTNVWGKSGLEIMCVTCDSIFISEI